MFLIISIFLKVFIGLTCYITLLHVPYSQFLMLYNYFIQFFYFLYKIFKVITNKELQIFTGHVARMEEGKRLFKILTSRSAGKSPIGMPRRRSEDST